MASYDILVDGAVWDTHDNRTGAARKAAKYRKETGLPVRIRRANPARLRVKRRATKKVRSVSLRNFTGKVRLNPDKSVSILGVGRKKKAKAKTRRRK